VWTTDEADLHSTLSGARGTRQRVYVRVLPGCDADADRDAAALVAETSDQSADEDRPGCGNGRAVGSIGQVRCLVEWSDYQKEIFYQVAETNKSLIIEAVAGCLSGETIIGIHRAGKSYKGTLAYLTEMMNGGKRSGRVFDPSIPTQVRSFDPVTGVVRLATVAKAVYSGKKRTFSVKTNHGEELRATEDHQFLARYLSEYRWMKLGHLGVGNSLLVDCGKSTEGRGEKSLYKNVYRMDHHPFRSVTHNRGVAYYRVPEHRLVMEAVINGVEFEVFVEEIQAGRIEGYQFLDPAIEEVHHRDENTLNNDPENLVVMTVKEHREHHAQEYWKNVQARVLPSIITDIEQYGEEDTF